MDFWSVWILKILISVLKILISALKISISVLKISISVLKISMSGQLSKTTRIHQKKYPETTENKKNTSFDLSCGFYRHQLQLRADNQGKMSPKTCQGKMSPKKSLEVRVGQEMSGQNVSGQYVFRAKRHPGQNVSGQFVTQPN